MEPSVFLGLGVNIGSYSEDVVSRCSEDVQRMFRGCSEDVVSRCSEDVQKMFRKCSEDVLSRCSEDVQMMFSQFERISIHFAGAGGGARDRGSVRPC